jgi:hypothetical protein
MRAFARMQAEREQNCQDARQWTDGQPFELPERKQHQGKHRHKGNRGCQGPIHDSDALALGSAQWFITVSLA